MAPPFLPEARVLLPRDPSIDSDDWPEFILHDARVSLPIANPKDLVSLLLAHENYPLRVTGRLQTPPPQDQLLLWRPQFRPKPSASNARQRTNPQTFSSSTSQHVSIELPDVRTIAYGAYENGEIDLWAACRAGWFLLRPARAYKRIFQDMVEAVNTLYFIVDAYGSTQENSGRRGTKKRIPSVKQLFASFSREMEGDAEDAAARIYRHREFLLGCMIAGREGVEWEGLPVWTHLVERFPEDVARIRSRLGEVVDGGQDWSVADQAVTEASTASANGLKRKRGGYSAGLKASTDAESKAKSEQEQHSTASRKASSRSRRDNPSSANSATASRRTRPNSRGALSESTPGSPSTPIADSDAEMTAFRSKNKSALRLKPSKPMKGLPRGNLAKGGKAPTDDLLDDDDDDNDDDNEHENEDEETILHTEQTSLPPPKLSGPGSKRRRDKLSVTSHHNSTNGLSSNNNLDEGIDIPSSPASSISSAHDLNHSSSSNNNNNLAATDHDIQTNRSSQQQPPFDRIWTCALAGCTYRISLGPANHQQPTPSQTTEALPSPNEQQDEEVQAQIREHYALHAYDDDARVRLVRNLQAPSLPAGFLLERVKMQARCEGFPGSSLAGTRFPQGLRRDFGG